MQISNFYQSLFIICGLILVVMFILEVAEKIQAELIKKVIYHRLHILWKLFSSVENGEIRDYIRETEILRSECESIYIEYIKNNKYLWRVFGSPEHLLRAFIATLDENELSNIKYEIICRTNDSEIMKTTKKENSKKVMFEKISFFTTIIGIIVTVLSFFL